MAKDVSRAIAAKGQPLATYKALEALTKSVVGAKLFTLTTVDPVHRGATRVYSNRPDVYPVSGTKPADETEWSKIVLVRQKVFVANTIEDIAKVFPDHALIKSIGCQSVINVPVVVGGRVIGTINCLHKRGHYTKARVKASEQLKLPGALAFLLHFAQEAKGTWS